MKLVLILALLMFFSCTKHSDIKVRNINLDESISENSFDSVLVKVESFYLEDGEKSGIGYLRNIIPIADKYLVVFDANLNEPIKIFDIKGKFLRILGRVGKGPGEYKFPIWVQADNKYLYLYDGQLRRLSIFDIADFSYISSFNTKYFYTGMLLFNDKILMKQQNWSERQTTVGKFDIYNKVGHILNDFTLGNDVDPKKINIEEIPEMNFGCALFDSKYLIYIDMMEYKLTCYNLIKNQIEWMTQLANFKRGEKKYNIFSLQNIDDQTIVLEMGANYYCFNGKGEYLRKIKLADPFISKIWKRNLLTATQPSENSKGGILNPKITIFKVK